MLSIGFGRGVVLVALAALALAMLAGCGGSSDAAPLKKKQFVQEAESICATAQKEREAQGNEVAKSGDSEEEVMQALLEPVETMVDELGDLGPPVGQEKEVEAIIAAYEAGISKLEAEPGAAKASWAFTKANGLAESYGLNGCAI